MSLRSDVQLACDALVRHKLRSTLTLLGMIFGVGAVVAMLTIGEGARLEAERVANRLGIDNLIIDSLSTSREQLEQMRSHSLGLRVQDIVAAERTLGFVLNGSGEKTVSTYDVHSQRGSSGAEVVGVTQGWHALANLRLSRGSFWSVDDALRAEPVAVLGANVARELFGESDPVGSIIKVNHAWFTVIGVVDAPELKSTEFGGVQLADDRSRIFIPLKSAWSRLYFDPLESELDAVRLKIDPRTTPQAAAVSVKSLLQARHGQQSDAAITIPAALLETQERTQRIFTIVLACIGGISLLVGGIGIMNVMLASVVERTQEIGLMRAVGARMVDVSRQFLVEGTLLSLLGGVVGIGFGVVVAAAAQYVSGWSIAFSLGTAFTALLVCLVVGVGFCIYPALQAARMDPIVALRKDAA